jgi:hypothetical protein
MTGTWTHGELDALAAADEVGISSYRPDGTARPFVTIWGVQAGDGVFIRSAYGTGNPWYRRAVAAGRGRVRFGDVETNVVFEPVPTGALDAQTAVDTAYRAKYAGYAARIVATVVGDTAHEATLRLIKA